MYMEIGRHRCMIPNAHIKIGSNSYEKVTNFKYFGSLLTNQNYIQEEIKCRQSRKFMLLFSPKIKIYKTIILPVMYMAVKHGLLL